MGISNELNSLEIIEFMLCNNYYGVSTSLINEILAYQSVTPIPNAHSCVEGIFMPRLDMLFMDLIDNIDEAKRTLLLQKSFNQIQTTYKDA